MRRNILKNERGDMSFFTIFVILAINMLLAFVLLYASIQINCINILQHRHKRNISSNPVQSLPVGASSGWFPRCAI